MIYFLKALKRNILEILDVMSNLEYHFWIFFIVFLFFVIAYTIIETKKQRYLKEIKMHLEKRDEILVAEGDSA